MVGPSLFPFWVKFLVSVVVHVWLHFLLFCIFVPMVGLFVDSSFVYFLIHDESILVSLLNPGLVRFVGYFWGSLLGSCCVRFWFICWSDFGV